MRLKASGLTHVGQVRPVNQDSYLVDADEQLYIVADGMGGHAGGEIASQLCVSEISSYMKKNYVEPDGRKSNDPDPRVSTMMASAVNHASTKIYERALEDPSLRGMGTTATVCKVIGETAYVAHVGDSRLYLVREGFIYQMTYDHSLVSEQVRAGLISEEEAELHHLRNVITRSVGYQEEEDVDTCTLQLRNEDLVVMCSDGLHGPVNDREISTMVAKERTSAVEPLVDLANSRGGDDNITVVVLYAS